MADIYTLLREGFKDILQELMEAELDATLGYEKNQKGGMETANMNIPASMSLLSGDRKPQIRFYGNRHSGYGNH